jgi:hypothetical protein
MRLEDPKRNPEMESFMSFEFPIARNVNARTIADSLESVTPKAPGKIKEQYENHWGETVTKYEGSMFSNITSNESHLMFGDRGHAFGFGYYVVNERGEMVYSSSEEYAELVEKCSKYWEAMEILRRKYKLPDYSVERGRGNRLVVNDKIIYGILIHPGSFGSGIITFLDTAFDLIDKEIESGRIKPGVYGRE